jgi:lipopolysaccharide export system permease protein
MSRLSEEQLSHNARPPLSSLAPFLHHPVSRNYVAGVLGDIVRIALIICLAVEGIFLSELLIGVLLPRVLEHRGNILTLVQLIGLSAPEGLFLSFPLAILMGCYLTLLRRREAGEFTVLAGMGYGVRLLIAIAVVTGVGSFAFSLLFSTYVEPLSRYNRERVFVDMAYEGMSNAEIGAGKFYTLDGLTVFASSGRLTQGADDVFIYQDKGADGQQLIMASQTEGVDDANGDPVGLMLDDITILSYAMSEANDLDCMDCGRQTIIPTNYSVISRLFVGLPDIPRPDAGTRRDSLINNTTIELLFQLDRQDAREIIGQRLLRSLLCFLAPMIALLAVALTRPATQLMALPAAAGIVLAVSFFGPRAAAAISAMPLIVSVALLITSTGLAWWVLHFATLRREATCLHTAKVNL